MTAESKGSLWLHDRKTCDCVRCKGFQVGNKLSPGATPKHGAYQEPLKLAPDAEKIALTVRPLMPVKSPAFEGTLQAYCILLARLQRAHKALEDEQVLRDQALEDDSEREPKLGYLAEEMRRWMASALKHATALGLTPASAASILRDTTGGHPETHRPWSQEELGQLSTAKLRELRDAMNKALIPDDFIDMEEV